VKPRIGEPSLYPGREVAVLYPGETATARISPEAVIHALATGQHEVPIEDWIVTPAPGVHAWLLRWRYRLIGRFLAPRPARLDIKAGAR
jgi:hypothetical protein